MCVCVELRETSNSDRRPPKQFIHCSCSSLLYLPFQFLSYLTSKFTLIKISKPWRSQVEWLNLSSLPLFSSLSGDYVCLRVCVFNTWLAIIILLKRIVPLWFRPQNISLFYIILASPKLFLFSWLSDSKLWNI